MPQGLKLLKTIDDINLALDAIHAAKDGITIVDMRLPEQPLIFINKAFEQITGYKKNEILGKNCRFLQGTLPATSEKSIIHRAIKAAKNCRVTLQNVKKDGTVFWNELSLAPIFDTNNQLTHYVGIQKDVTNEIVQKQKIDYLAEHDDLTDLFNYRGFFRKVKSLVKRAEREHLLMSIGIADIDNFKEINDLQGHIYGNHVLKIIASELKHEFRADDIAARFGGDEFCFAMLLKEDGKDFFYTKIAHVVKATNFSLSNSLQISMSSGIAIEKAGSNIKIEHLITQADIIMYDNKQLSRLNLLKNS